MSNSQIFHTKLYIGRWVLSFKRIVVDFSNLTFILAIGEKHFYNSKGGISFRRTTVDFSI